MRKFLALLASLCLLFAFATACDKNNSEAQFGSSQSSSTGSSDSSSSEKDDGSSEDKDSSGGQTGDEAEKPDNEDEKNWTKFY